MFILITIKELTVEVDEGTILFISFQQPFNHGRKFLSICYYLWILYFKTNNLEFKIWENENSQKIGIGQI